MRCSSCTTELWGNPSACPVCGTPVQASRPQRRPQRAGTPPWGAEAADADLPTFFNASDLLDPQVAEALPQAPSAPTLDASGFFDPQLLDTSEPTAEAGTGAKLNAADLFDADLFDPPESTAPPEPTRLNAADLFDPDVFGTPPATAQPQAPWNAADLFDSQLRNGVPPAPPREPPRAMPFLTLPPLGASGGQSRPPSAPRIAPSGQADPFAFPPAPPEEDELDPLEERGWHIVSSASPASPSWSNPLSAAPASTLPPGRRNRSPKGAQAGGGGGRRWLNLLGGTIGLLVALSVLGGAILYGYLRDQSLQTAQAISSQATPSPLPTIASKPNYTIYSDHALGFSLQYPNSWKQSAGLADDDPQYHSDIFSVSPYAWLEVGSSAQYSGWSVDQMNTHIINEVGKRFQTTNINTFEPDLPINHIAGQDWTVEDADVVLPSGAYLRLTTLAIQHNGRGYIVFYMAERDLFSSYSIQFFEPMLLSFRFLG